MRKLLRQRARAARASSRPGRALASLAIVHLVCMMAVGSGAHAAPGLNVRPLNPTCVAHDRPGTGSSVSVALEPAFAPLSFINASDMAEIPGSPDLRFVVQLWGIISRVDTSGVDAASSIALDFAFKVHSGGELGMYGIALHPDFSNNGYAYLHYIEQDVHGVNKWKDFWRVVSRVESLDGGLTFDASTETILIREHYTLARHMGGGIEFGPDGYLYISFGDNSVAGGSQDTTNYLGSMVRIDVDSGTPYGIPVDNPLVSDPNAAQEIWAWGLRNAWQFSFDSSTGDLWAGDVGQWSWEEVNQIQPGNNYGWSTMEGFQCFGGGACDSTGMTNPFMVYDHETGCSITGGYVYRGSAIAALAGLYVYGDYCTGSVSAAFDDAGTPTPQMIVPYAGLVLAFHEDVDQELYVLGSSGIQKIVPYVGPPPDPYPTLLSETGCFDSSDPTIPELGLIPYDINSPLWSDGATKRRWIAIPDGSTIEFYGTDDWWFPIGTVLVKEFSINGKRVETRLFERHDDGGWGGYSFEWNQAETEATLLTSGKVDTIDGIDWQFPSGDECLLCHTYAASRALGPEHLQMNRDFTYPSTAITANQLETFEFIGMFTDPLPDTPPNIPALPAPSDTSELLDRRARSYLHTNCSSCHRAGGTTQAGMDFHFATSNENMNACNVTPTLGDLGIVDPKILAPADPAKSILSVRMHRLGAERMPPLGTSVLDPSGTALIDNWIESWLVGTSNECLGPDSDFDQLHDGAETNTLSYVSPDDTGTDPGVSDTDGDGFDDGVEVWFGTDPTDPLDAPAISVPALAVLGQVILGGAITAVVLRRHRTYKRRSGSASE